jgi:monoamine oxidase
MGESINCGICVYFMRKQWFGTLFSQASKFQEMYDHVPPDYKGYALKGFLNGGTHTRQKKNEKRK